MIIFTGGNYYKLTSKMKQSTYATGYVSNYAVAHRWMKAKRAWSKTAGTHHFNEYEVMTDQEIKQQGLE